MQDFDNRPRCRSNTHDLSRPMKDFRRSFRGRTIARPQWRRMVLSAVCYSMQGGADHRPSPIARSASARCGGCGEGFVGAVGVDRLELAEAGGDQPLRRDAPARSDIARPRSRAPPTGPSWCGTAAGDRPHVGVAVDAQHPGDLLRESCWSSSISAAAILSSSARPSGLSTAWPVSKNTSDWNTKRSPTTRISGRLPRMARSRAEEVGAVARQLLHALGQRDVEPLAEIGDARLRILVALLRDVERRFERAELAPQRGDLLVEHLDLRQRPQRDLLLGVELAGQLGDLALRGGVAAAEIVVEAPVCDRARFRLAARLARSCAIWSSSEPCWSSRATAVRSAGRCGAESR